MTIPTGVMQLLKAEPLDVIEDFENGLAPDGGEWTNWERLSAHNHGGGLLGAPITVTAAMIPDGSITAGKLDPSVLAPYTLTDGSKPFTGQVTMQADAVIRDTLSFGEQGTALAPDAILTRTIPGEVQLSGVRADLEVLATGATTPAHVGQAQAGRRLDLTVNAWHDGANWLRDDPSLPALSVALASTDTGSESIFAITAIPSGANPVGTFISRLGLNRWGTLTLSPDAGQPSLVVPGGAGAALLGQGVGNLNIRSTAPYNIAVGAAGGSFTPETDNAIGCGYSTLRWTVVYATSGTISTSSAEAKTGITPLDPAAALAAVRATTPVTFDYLAPERSAEAYDLPPDPEQAQQVLEQRLRSGPLETAARHQAGVVLDDPAHPCDPLFQTGDGQTNASNSVGILLASIKELDRRMTAGGL